jgi:hypothetical protein
MDDLLHTMPLNLYQKTPQMLYELRSDGLVLIENPPIVGPQSKIKPDPQPRIVHLPQRINCTHNQFSTTV